MPLVSFLEWCEGCGNVCYLLFRRRYRSRRRREGQVDKEATKCGAEIPPTHILRRDGTGNDLAHKARSEDRGTATNCIVMIFFFFFFWRGALLFCIWWTWNVKQYFPLVHVFLTNDYENLEKISMATRWRRWGHWLTVLVCWSSSSSFIKAWNGF